MISISKFDPEYDQAMDKVVGFEKWYEDMALSPENKENLDSLLGALDDVQKCKVSPAFSSS